MQPIEIHKSNVVVVLITAPSLKTAEDLAKVLVENKAAACVNLVTAIRSFYFWEEQIHDDEEVLMIIKTRAQLVEEKLIPLVKSIHPYKVPEIIALPVTLGDQPYLEWLRQNTA